MARRRHEPANPWERRTRDGLDDQIQAKALDETGQRVEALSEDKIRRVFEHTVAPHFCIDWALDIKDAGNGAVG